MHVQEPFKTQVQTVSPLLLLDAQCQAGRSDAIAVRWLGAPGQCRDLTYGQMLDYSARCAALLRQLGLKPGQTVAVMTGRRPETLVAALGIWRAGGVYCPLFADLGPDPLLARLTLGQARILLVGGEAYGRAVAAIRGSLPQLAHVLVLGDEIPADCLDLRTALASASPSAEMSPADLATAAMMHFTSGTTAPLAGGSAQPKAVIHDARVVELMVSTARAAFGLAAGEMLWCTAEPGWIPHTAYGLVAPLATGATILLDAAPTTPMRCLSVLEDEPVAIWYTGATVIRNLIGGGAAPARSFHPRALRLAATVGEPLSADAVEWGQKVLGVPFRDTWWQTEIAGIAMVHDLGQRPLPGSMGKPLKGLCVALVRRDGSCLSFCADTGEATGELALRIDSLPPWRSLGGESSAPPQAVDGWHLTGDLVRRDGDGYYWFLGRIDDLINSGGRRIGPFEVEAVLMSHPAVGQAGVVGVPDPRLNEKIVAFVVVNPGFDPGDALRAELHAFAREHLGKPLSPQEIRFERRLPSTATGKIIRHRLRALYLADAAGLNP